MMQLILSQGYQVNLVSWHLQRTTFSWNCVYYQAEYILVVVYTIVNLLTGLSQSNLAAQPVLIASYVSIVIPYIIHMSILHQKQLLHTTRVCWG
jgi:hypothetical protein